MRLPGRQEGAVQQLQGVDPGVYAQRGQAVGGAFDVGADIAHEWGQKAAEAAGREALVDMSNTLTKFRNQYGNKRTFTEDEVEALGGQITDDQRYTERTDDAGRVIREEKTEFDAEDFYPDALKRKWEAEAELRAKQIPGPGRRDKFLARQQELINNSYEQEMRRAHATREAKLNTRYEVDIQNAEISGNYAVAKELVRQHPNLSQEDKDKEVTRLHQEEEKRMLAHLRMNDQAPDAALQAQIERLESPIYGGDAEGDQMNSLTITQREQEVKSLKAVLKAREKDREDAAGLNLARFYMDFYETVDDPDTTRTDGLAMIEHGLASGSLKPADVTRLRKYVNEVKGGGGIEQRSTAAELKFIEMDNLPIDVLQGMEYQGKLDDLAGVISTEQLKHLKQKARAGVESGQSEWKENVDYLEAQLGFVLPEGANDKEKQTYAQQQAAARQLLYGQFRRFAQVNGRPPDANEREEMTDRLIMSQVRERRFFILTNDPKYKTREQSLKDVPYQRWGTITDVLSMAGITTPRAADYHAVSGLIERLDDLGISNPTVQQINEARELMQNARSPNALNRWVEKQKRLETIE